MRVMDDLNPNVAEYNLGCTALMGVCQQEGGLDVVKLLDKALTLINKITQVSGYTLSSLIE